MIRCEVMANIVRSLVALFVVAAPNGQGLRAVKPEPAPATPIEAPEPTFSIGEDPAIIFQQLLGSSAQARREALSALGWKAETKYAEDPKLIGNARLYRGNLDDDPEMEAILMADVGNGRETRVLIFKKSPASWWCVGSFSLWYMWADDEAERMIELRNIVDFDHKDIIIRTTAGGTDIQREIELGMYRLYAGRLYRTFSTTEEYALRKFSSPGREVIDDERHHIYYPEKEQGTDPYIVESTLRRVVSASRWGRLQGPFTMASCTPYRLGPKAIFVRC